MSKAQWTPVSIECLQSVAIPESRIPALALTSCPGPYNQGVLRGDGNETLIKEFNRKKHIRKTKRDETRNNQDIEILKNVHLAKDKANNTIIELVKNKFER